MNPGSDFYAFTLGVAIVFAAMVIDTIDIDRQSALGHILRAATLVGVLFGFAVVFFGLALRGA